MITQDEVNAKVDAVFDEIVKTATDWKPSAENMAKQDEPYPAKTFTFKGTYADVNRLFQQRKWSLSLPIVPPTVEMVQKMLKGTNRDPSEVVWVVPPREGMLTVELVATLGVMAGAQPEHMPLLLAAVEAMADPKATFRGPTTTTAPAVPVFWISGPIVEKLKLNPGTGTAGGENPVTNALGYFVNLVADVVGGSMPPNFDKSTHGTSADLVAMVFTENEAANPWKTTYAQGLGFSKDDSVISFVACYPGNANVDHGAKAAKRLLHSMAAGILGTPSAANSCLADPDLPDSLPNKAPYVFLMLCPEHSGLIAKEFPVMEDAKTFLREVTKMPYKYYGDSLCVPPAEFGPYNEDTMMPRFKKNSSINFVVTGGPGKQSQIWTPLPRSVAVSKKIAE